MDPVLPGIARFQPSPNRSGKFSASLPDTVVVHYTAGTTLAGAIATLCSQAAKASAHFVVDRDGSVVQLVELDTIAWHAGKSRHLNRTGLNEFSIGIEIVNAGKLKRNAAGEFLTWAGGRIEPQQAIELVHRNESAAAWWHAYTETQIESVFELTRKLTDGLPIRHILGHEEIAPGRKSDPGPAFPLDAMRARLLGTERDLNDDIDEVTQAVDGIVAASMLNTRTGPSVTSPIASVPLRRGTAVTIVGSQPDWLRISRPVSAWVKREFINITSEISVGHSPFQPRMAGRPDSGSNDRPDSGSNDRPDSGSNTPPDSSVPRIGLGR